MATYAAVVWSTSQYFVRNELDTPYFLEFQHVRNTAERLLIYTVATRWVQGVIACDDAARDDAIAL